MSSHASAPATTSLLTVLAVTLVHREHPDWLAVGVGDAARAAGLNPERVSRLASRVVGPFRDIVDALTRRGRPARKPAGDALHAELVRLRALLAVASAALALVPLHKRAARALIVGAWRRLATELPSLTKSTFCEALALPERTLRHWLAHAPATTTPASSPRRPSQAPRPKPPKRTLRRPRFRFDVFLPGMQVGGDTTALEAFGVDLKLVGVQDIGGRDHRLFDAVVIDTHECSDHVIKAFRTVLTDCPGAQAITDQGTPYMAGATRAALEALEAEHAPQKEGDPTGKSTVEKGFGTLKGILEPMLSLTSRLAEIVPQLRSPDLAVPFARLAVGTVLRAYQAGARATRRALDARGPASEDTLVRAAARAREAARADNRSARLLLSHLHGLYVFHASCTSFVDRFRRYPLDVLRAAEAALRRRLIVSGAPDVRHVDRYFGALVRSALAEHRARRAERAASGELDARLRRENDATDAARREHAADPARWLRDALDLLVMQWVPAQRQLLFGGDGLGLGWMRGAIGVLLERHGDSLAADVAAGVLDEFLRARRDALGDDGAAAIATLLQRELALARARHLPLADHPPSAIPAPIGRSTRSVDPSPLSS
jgi:hypothetical protein